MIDVRAVARTERVTVLATLSVAMLTASCEETVGPTAVAKVTISADSVDLAAGDTMTLTATTLDEAGNVLTDREITWETLTPTHLSVEPTGLVTAVWRDAVVVQPALVVATSEGVSDTAMVVVVSSPVATVDVSPDSTYLMIGHSRTLTARMLDVESRELAARLVTWSSSDSAIARVSEFGRVTGVAPGTAMVTAASEGMVGSATVTVGNLQIVVSAPPPSGFVGDTVLVRVAVFASVYQIAGVTATLGADSVALAYNQNLREWRGTLAIEDEPFGPSRLRATARDVFGSTHTIEVPVVHDPPPVLTIVAPAQGAVATPTTRFAFSCADRNAVACRNVEAHVRVGATLASGTSSVDAQVSLGSYEGQLVEVVFTATDSVGQFTFATREVRVFSTGMQRAVEVAGTVLDYDGARTLYSVRQPDGRDVVRIRLGSGSDEIVYDVAGQTMPYRKAFLTPLGAIFASNSGSNAPDSLHELRNGAMSNLDAGYVSTLAVKGGFGLWLTGLSGSPLRLRDVLSGQTTTVANDAGNTEYDVTEDGDVAYWTTGYQVVYVPFGELPTALSSGPQWNTYPRLSDSLVVYRKSTPCCNNQTYAIYLAYPGGGETALTPMSTADPQPDRDYVVRKGWVAYTQVAVTGERQVWSRSPADVRTQVSFFAAHSRIEGLDANGAIVFESQDKRYLAEPPYTTLTPLGSAVGVVEVRGGQFVILVGGSVFAVP